MDQIVSLALNSIAPDSAQPRKSFDEKKLQELAVSIGAHGVEQAIRVRPHPKKEGLHMIIFGERRWRAAGIAGLTEIPAVVEEIDDEAAILERQIVENNQRDDIHPLEEGEAYQALHKKHGATIEDLIAKTGKSRSHIYARMKLTELAPGVKKAMLDGRLPHAHGELIGRIPDKALQEQCCKEVLGDLKGEANRELRVLGIEHETVGDEGKYDGDRQALSFRATAALVRRRFQTKLSLATFDPSDVTLTKAGACGPCAHRSGNQPELPGMPPAAKNDDHCSNLVCFELKTQAQFTRASAKATEAGMKVVSGKKATDLFYNNGELKTESGYALPDQALPYDVVHSYDSKHTYKKILGKHLGEVKKVLVQNDRGEAVEVLDRAHAIEIAREHKLLPKKTANSSELSPSQKKHRQEEKERKVERRERESTYEALITQAMLAVGKDWPASKETALWRFVAIALGCTISYGDRERLQNRRGFAEYPEREEIAKFANGLKAAGDLRALVIEMLMCTMADEEIDGFGDTDEAMDLAQRLFGLDRKKAELQAKAEQESLALSERAAKEAAKSKAGAK